jgi:hypothetical protein
MIITSDKAPTLTVSTTTEVFQGSPSALLYLRQIRQRRLNLFKLNLGFPTQNFQRSITGRRIFGSSDGNGGSLFQASCPKPFQGAKLRIEKLHVDYRFTGRHS